MKQLRIAGVLALVFLPGLLILRSGATAAATAGVEGRVTDSETGESIAGAHVDAPGLGLSAVSGPDGAFEFQDTLVSDDSVDATITISATAAGYGDWTIQDVRLIAGDTLILDIKMGRTPTLIVVPPPRAEAPDWPTEQLTQGFQGGFGSLQADHALPATIRVRVTGYPYCDLSRPYTVETLDFKEYAKHVLPNEWVAGWPWESLRAGAMAVKMYAWSYITVGGKWSDADVYDSTCDQVYNPAVSYSSTNQAVDFTWNWRLTRNDQLLRTFYRTYLSQCEGAGLGGNCMGQIESHDMAHDLYTWDEILLAFYDNGELSPVWNPPGGYSLRFYGNGYGDLDRVKIPIDPPVPADVGAKDLTLEWWMKALPGENSAAGCTPGGDNWIFGNILFDRDVFGDGDYGDYGISLANGRLAFGVANGSATQTICGATDVADGQWHHLAVSRDLAGEMRIFVDGHLDAVGSGPSGDISYRDGRTTSYASDPYLVLGAEKHDADNATYPSFSGWLDEIRMSNSTRYSADFTPPGNRFTSDANTVALYHLNEGFGNTIGDSSGYAGGPSHGQRKYGGVSNGPAWTDDTNWYVPPPTPTPTPTPPASPTPTATPTFTPTSAPLAAVRFAVIGDYGDSGQAELDVANLVKSWSPDFIITTGDNNYPSGISSTIDGNIGQYYQEFIFPYAGSYGSGASTNRFFPSLGNHDWQTANAQPYLDYFTLPGNERYYDFVWGPLHFFALDSDSNEPDGTSTSSAQAAWMQTAMAASTSPWKIVYMHHPPYSSGSHGSKPLMQWPFQIWGATAVIAGHDHTYERIDVNGTPYFVNGLGGRSIYGFGTSVTGSQLRFNADYGAMLVTADQESITFQFISRDSAIIDTYSIYAPTPIPTSTPTPLPTFTPTPLPTAIPVFDDVPPGHWAYDHINALYAAGIVAGCSADPLLYCPDSILNRAESAVFVLRGAYGAIPDPPYPPPSAPTFVDVDPGFWGHGWIESLWTDGFTAGCNADPLMYCPDGQHTRAEGSVFFLRIKNGVDYVPPDAVGIFADVDLGTWYAGWVEAAYSEGILPACQTAPLGFCPEDELDRAWAAYMMVQAKDIPIP